MNYTNSIDTATHSMKHYMHHTMHCRQEANDSAHVLRRNLRSPGFSLPIHTQWKHRRWRSPWGLAALSNLSLLPATHQCFVWLLSLLSTPVAQSQRKKTHEPLACVDSLEQPGGDEKSLINSTPTIPDSTREEMNAEKVWKAGQTVLVLATSTTFRPQHWAWYREREITQKASSLHAVCLHQ